jgi:hypothetical protein
MTLQATIHDDDGTRADFRPTTGHPVDPPVSDGRREDAVRALLRLLEANRRLQTTLQDSAAMCEASLLELLEGADPADLLDGLDVARARLELADSLAGFDRARHSSRSTFIAAQFLHGMNMKEIGRRWGISRQLAHRFFKEAHRAG